MSCPECDRMRSKYAKVWRENKRLRRDLETKREQLLEASPATDGEIRAAYRLGVSVGQLRTWAKQGIGPQPPYTDEEIDGHQSWVEARVGREGGR